MLGRMPFLFAVLQGIALCFAQSPEAWADAAQEFDRLKNAEDPREEGEKIAIEQIQEVRDTPGVAGVHIMAIEAEKSVAGLVEKAGLLPRPE